MSGEGGGRIPRLNLKKKTVYIKVGIYRFSISLYHCDSFFQKDVMYRESKKKVNGAFDENGTVDGEDVQRYCALEREIDYE